MIKILTTFFWALLGVSTLTAQTTDIRKVDARYLKNLYKLNDSIYRSEQPGRKGFRELEAMGIKSVLNFRRLKDDNRKAAGTALHLEHLRLKSKELSREDIVEAMRIIREVEKPLLMHCWHGSDRTGAMSAAYRVIFEGWSKEMAIKELRMKDLGYHENWYPNIIDLIRDLDVDQIRKELNIY